MRIVLIGQQAFGKATLEAFLARGDTVAAVFCAPETGRPDPLRLASEAAGVPTFLLPKLTDPEALEALRAAKAEVGVMAYVTQFVSQAFCAIPKFGMIQFHPSLLPLHRGASALGWSIILGRTQTGFSIFRPVDGWDEGPVIFSRTVLIEAEDTLGSLYFGKVFPMGVAGLIEAADLVVAGKAPAVAQYEPAATYEGIIGMAESKISWATHIDITFNLIRGCDPSPGAWTTHEGRRLFLYSCHKRVARRYREVKGMKVGQVVAVGGGGVTVYVQGGFIVVDQCRPEGGQKIAADKAGLVVGTLLGQ